MKNKSVYILLSRTTTAVGSLVRHFGNVYYNHSALALDKDLSRLYSFGRPEHVSLFRGRFVKETIHRYLGNSKKNIPAVIIEIPVTEKQYFELEQKIQEIESDREYMYNLMSVLTYPIIGGFRVYKSYSCIEFVIAMLQMFDYSLNLPACKYTPDDVYRLYQNYIIYDGDLNHYTQYEKKDESYFSKLTFALFCLNIFGFYKLMKRFMFSFFIEFL